MSDSPSKARHPRDVLDQHQARVKKSFGQNFLIDEHHLSAIASQIASLTAPGQFVVEIGAGLGALTQALLSKGLVVHAIERDRDMARILRLEYADWLSSSQLTLHEDNATTFDYEKLVHEQGGAQFVLCGNLPYHLTSSLIFQAIDLISRISGAVFMIQKEVAERIVAPEGSRDYGILSVLVQAQFHVRITHQVPSGAFWPRPLVDSAVITMKPRTPQQLSKDEASKLKRIVKAAFSTRRKTLRNCLKDLMPIEEICSQIGISADLRPETLSPSQFIDLMRAAP